MRCWMTATGSLTSRDSFMDVVMQYKTIISTIKREEPMSFWSKSNIVGLRQVMLWKEEQWVRVTEVNLRKADRFPCTILCLSLILSRIGRMEEWFRILSRTEQLILSNVELECGPLAFHLCVQMLWEKRNWEGSPGPLLCCDSQFFKHCSALWLSG